MRRLFLAALAALFVAAPAFGGTGSWPAGLTTYTFQEGVYPTSAYSGTEDTYVHNDSTAGPSLKIRNYGAAKVLKTTSNGYGSGEQAFMCKFTFLASDGVTGGVPANFVCTYARVSFYQVGPTGTDASAGPGTLINAIWCYRSLYTWTEGSGTGIAAGLCNFDSASTRGYWNFDESNANNQRWRAGALLENGTGNTDSTSQGATGFYGVDTLFQSVPTVAATAASGDHKAIPADVGSIALHRTQSAAPQAAKRFGRVYWDVTHDVSLMISGANKNNGWIFTADEATTFTGVVTFASSEYTASKNYRPMLEIWGYTISAGGGSTGRRYLGGRSGVH